MEPVTGFIIFGALSLAGLMLLQARIWALKRKNRTLTGALKYAAEQARNEGRTPTANRTPEEELYLTLRPALMRLAEYVKEGVVLRCTERGVTFIVGRTGGRAGIASKPTDLGNIFKFDI